MPVSEKTYHEVALEDPEGKWELVCGHLRSKPGMSFVHNEAQRRLAWQLFLQLDPQRYSISVDAGRLRIGTGTFYIPDLVVVPRQFIEQKLHEAPYDLEVYDEPMPLVIEVWSPSTGDYDVAQKLAEYQNRGDLEIWRLHPIEKTLVRWQRQQDGSYSDSILRHGVVQPAALPGIRIDIDSLFT